jgi:hypothetical protein
MFKRITFDQFLLQAELGSASLLFIKEQSCKYCENAEREIQKGELENQFKSMQFFELYIDDHPELPAQLGLVGVPAFFKIDPSGRKRMKVGFDGLENLKHFLTD